MAASINQWIQPSDVHRIVYDFIFKKNGISLRPRDTQGRARFEQQYYNEARTFDGLNMLTDAELTTIFTTAVESRNHRLFAINYNVDPEIFTSWLNGIVPGSINSRRTVILFLISGETVTNVKAETTVTNLNKFNYKCSCFLLCDGDNIQLAAIPLFIFGTIWKDIVSTSIFYRNDGYPGFIKPLQDLLEAPVNVVGSFGTYKDASDVSFIMSTMYLLGQSEYYSKPNILYLVSNDKIVNEVQLTASNILINNPQQLAGTIDPRAIDPQSKGDARRLPNQLWNVNIPEFNDQDNIPTGYTQWFVEFIKKYDQLPVPNQYGLISEIIRNANSGKEIFEQIIKRVVNKNKYTAERITKQLNGVNENYVEDRTAHILYQQYMVLTGKKYITSIELGYLFEEVGLIEIMINNSTVIDSISGISSYLDTKTILDNNELLDFNYQQDTRKLTQDGISLLKVIIVPDSLYLLYKTATFTEALQNSTIQVALNIISITVINNDIKEIIFTSGTYT